MLNPARKFTKEEKNLWHKTKHNRKKFTRVGNVESRYVDRELNAKKRHTTLQGTGLEHIQKRTNSNTRLIQRRILPDGTRLAGTVGHTWAGLAPHLGLSPAAGLNLA